MVEIDGEDWGKYKERVDNIIAILPEIKKTSDENNRMLISLTKNPLLNGIMQKHLDESVAMRHEVKAIKTDVSNIKDWFDKFDIIGTSRNVKTFKWIIGVLLIGLITMGGAIIKDKYFPIKQNIAHDTTIIIKQPYEVLEPKNR